MRKLLLTALIALALLMTGCNHFPNASLTILSHDWEVEAVYDWWRVEITGIAINDGNRRLRYAEIQCKIYNEANVMVGQDFTNCTGLDKGESWAFTLYDSPDLEPHHYTIWVEQVSY